MTRNEIYKVIEKITQDDNGSGLDAPNVSYWLVGLKSGLAEIDAALTSGRFDDSLSNLFATLTCCCLCMMENGVVWRGAGPVGERIVVRGRATLPDVVCAINGERAYQDVLPSSRTDGIENTPFAYATMFDTYLRRAIDAWTNTAGVYDSLDEIRKLAGICVHCLEDCY